MSALDVGLRTRRSACCQFPLSSFSFVEGDGRSWETRGQRPNSEQSRPRSRTCSRLWKGSWMAAAIKLVWWLWWHVALVPVPVRAAISGESGCPEVRLGAIGSHVP
uniref:Uncharacterized protein n=1 Tax=Haptolina brevifila TaxID=156173 RepID=A0A7S2IFE2_9EUKA